jgi:ABC-type branched-subunit amino acid transport system ATPase component
MPLLEVRNVSYAFGGVKALDDVSLAVNEGEILSIIGPNGAGKTTLFNVISGLLRPPRGSVLLDGQTLTRRAPYRIARLGIGRTNQIVRPFGRLSVVDNVAVGALIHERSLRGARAAAREIVDFVGLGALGDRNAGTLTLTQRKRLEVARALALKPRLLLLDEVMAGLTPSEMDTMAEFILALPKRGIAAIAGIEHVMRLVMRISHRIVVLDYGRKIAEGTPAEIRSDPRVIEAYLGAPLEVL